MLTGFPLLLLITCAIVYIVIAGTVFKLHAFLVLLSASLLTGIISGMPLREISAAANEGFGDMMKHIGLIIIMGTLIGSILEKTGATIKIAKAVLRLTGNKYPVLAVTLIGVIVGIPVFCDSGFVILSGLIKPIAHKSRAGYSAIVCALASGLYITHTLLPPHPGSVAGAANFGLANHYGTVIFTGCIVTIPVTLIAWIFSSRIAARVKVDSAMQTTEAASAISSLPSLWLCILSVIVPVMLIAAASFAHFFSIKKNLLDIISFAGEPLIALLLGFLLSLLIINANQKKYFAQYLKEAIIHAGNILVIVGAGGVLGAILKKLPLAEAITAFAGESNNAVSFIVLAWFIGAALKTAQGSTTAAIIVATTVMAPLMQEADFHTPQQISLLLAATAGGTMMISHANDAYFWVITQFSGMNMQQTYKSFSLATIAMSIAVLITVITLYIFLY